MIDVEQSLQLVEWARSAAPREACGYLFGRAHTGRIEVCAVVSAPNLALGEDEFLVDPGEIVRTELDARRRGLELVGFWHSHPRGPAIPSAKDERAAWPGYLCVIVGLGSEPSIRAWISVGGRLVESPRVLHAAR